MYCITDPIEAHRELQRQLQSGAITPAEYRAAFRTTDAAHSDPWCCESPSCRQPATARQNGLAYCATHWMEARNDRQHEHTHVPRRGAGAAGRLPGGARFGQPLRGTAAVRHRARRGRRRALVRPGGADNRY